MITRGSKFFYGAAAFLYLTALVYGFVSGASAHGGVLAVFSDGALVDSIIGPISFGWKGWVGDQIGYSVLMGAAGAMAVLGGLTSAFRDGSPEALAELQGATVERSVIQGDTLVDLRVASPQGLNVWPLVGALSAGLVVIGAAISSPFFILGLVILGLVAVEWTVRVWSDQATGDPVANRAARNRMLNPIEIPVIAIIGIALFVLSISRILLALPEGGSYFVFGGVPLMLFAIAILLNARPNAGRAPWSPRCWCSAP